MWHASKAYGNVRQKKKKKKNGDQNDVSAKGLCLMLFKPIRPLNLTKEVHRLCLFLVLVLSTQTRRIPERYFQDLLSFKIVAASTRNCGIQ